nr:PP0621 family protein [Rubrivivax gelatinosus]
MLVIAVVGIVLWLMFGRGRRAARPAERSRAAARAEPAEMVACAHCGVHLPADEAVADAAGRRYCGEAHRLAGPR